MLQLNHLPLSVLNRALELFNEPAEVTFDDAIEALLSAESRKSAHCEFPGITPFAQAVAEYLSLSGPWNEDTGQHAGESGYTLAA